MANALVSIKPGAGGTDACDFAETMYRMYIRWSQRHGFTVETVGPVRAEGAAVSSSRIRDLLVEGRPRAAACGGSPASRTPTSPRWKRRWESGRAV